MKLNIEKIQVDCSTLSQEQINTLVRIVKEKGYKIGSMALVRDNIFFRCGNIDSDFFFIVNNNEKYTIITYEEFVSQFDIDSEFNTKEPFIERVMLVSDDNIDWRKRVVFAIKNDQYIAWVDAETMEEAKNETNVATWLYAKELPELTKTEVTQTLYHIVSLKWTHKQDDWITFYRHNSNGYCWRKEWTGEFENPNVDNYNEIKIEIDKLKDFWVKDIYDGNEIMVIPNNKNIRKILGIQLKDLKRLYPS